MSQPSRPVAAGSNVPGSSANASSSAPAASARVTLLSSSAAVKLPADRDLGPQRRSLARGRIELEPPPERLHAVGQPAQPGAAVRAAPPTPSSRTSMHACEFERPTPTVTSEARAYLATLVSASATT